MKQSKVKAVQPNGTWESQHGLFYKYEYTMEDGTVINAQHKSQTPFNTGELVEYEVKGTNDYGSWGKVGKPQEQSNFRASNNSSSTSDSILFQVCLKGIMDFYIANGNPAQWNDDSIVNEAFNMAQKAKAKISQL